MAVAVDAVALLVFVVVGVLTHDASATAFARDALCFLGAWFAVAAVLRLYTRGGRWRFVATWLVGITAGFFVRAAIVGHVAFAFWGVALGFTLLFLLIARRLRHLVSDTVGV